MDFIFSNLFIYIVIVIIVVWLLLGYYNYKQLHKAIDAYEERYTKHETLEKELTEVSLKAKHFNAKEEMITKYSSLHQSMLARQEDETKFKRSSLLNCLRLGVLLNFVQ